MLEQVAPARTRGIGEFVRVGTLPPCDARRFGPAAPRARAPKLRADFSRSVNINLKRTSVVTSVKIPYRVVSYQARDVF